MGRPLLYPPIIRFFSSFDNLSSFVFASLNFYPLDLRLWFTVMEMRISLRVAFETYLSISRFLMLFIYLYSMHFLFFIFSKKSKFCLMGMQHLDGD